MYICLAKTVCLTELLISELNTVLHRDSPSKLRNNSVRRFFTIKRSKLVTLVVLEVRIIYIHQGIMSRTVFVTKLILATLPVRCKRL